LDRPSLSISTDVTAMFPSLGIRGMRLLNEFAERWAIWGLSR
jgi:hypothetical protein